GAYTIASQAFKVLRTFLKEDLWSLSPELDFELRKSYYGGRVEIFRPLYKDKKPLYCYDVNSLYPSVMKGNTYPNGFSFETHKFYDNGTGFYQCKVKVPKKMYLPPLGIVLKGK